MRHDGRVKLRLSSCELDTMHMAKCAAFAPGGDWKCRTVAMFTGRRLKSFLIGQRRFTSTNLN